MAFFVPAYQIETCMEAVIPHNDRSSFTSLKQALELFFSKNTPDTVRCLIWKLFQCYVTRDCNIKAEVPDKEVALFYDQLIELVNAAYVVHQADRASLTENGGNQHV
jgi:hypothetical protein